MVGAGNLNDVELSQLQRIYAHIELIDIDLAALERGLRRQMVAPGSPSITLRGVDVLGLSDGAHYGDDRTEKDDRTERVDRIDTILLRRHSHNLSGRGQQWRMHLPGSVSENGQCTHR